LGKGGPEQVGRVEGEARAEEIAGVW